MNLEFRMKRTSQKNTNHLCKWDENDNACNMLINSNLNDSDSSCKILVVNKMLFVLIFLMVK